MSKFEVVIVSTLKYTPTDEIAQNAEAIAARRIFKRIDGQRQHNSRRLDLVQLGGSHIFSKSFGCATITRQDTIII